MDFALRRCCGSLEHDFMRELSVGDWSLRSRLGLQNGKL